jgi:hypothetical protein
MDRTYDLHLLSIKDNYPYLQLPSFLQNIISRFRLGLENCATALSSAASVCLGLWIPMSFVFGDVSGEMARSSGRTSEKGYSRLAEAFSTGREP